MYSTVSLVKGKPMRDKIEEVLDEIRPTLQADGGDVEFIDFNADSGTVMVRMKGACGNCPMSLMTLKQGIEARMKARITALQAVEQI